VRPPGSGLVLGGGGRKADCYSSFAGLDAADFTPTKVVCQDGDACDADGIVDHQCTFDVSVCGPTTIDGCTPRSVISYRGTWVNNGYPLPRTPTDTATTS